MKLVKSLLLGSAAGLCAVAGAQAADLPMRKAAPVEYVRVCTAYGAGFFYIPGTDTCLRVGGRARFEYQFTQQNTRASSVSGYRGLARINIDARTQTPYGALRAFVRIEVASRTGGYLKSGTAERYALSFTASGQDTFNQAQKFVEVDKAFVQFAGLTAGRAQSFFDFYSGDVEMIGSGNYSSTNTNLFAYTATFGSGFSATVAAEDPTARRNPVFLSAQAGTVGLAAGAAPAAQNGVNFLSGAIPFGFVAVARNAAGIPTAAVALDVGQRNNMPDFVGALRYDAAWGSAQVSGAVHEIRVGTYNGGNPSAPFTATPFAVGAGAAAAAAAVVANAQVPSAAYGFAFQGGLKINVPQLAPGDQLWLQGAYAQGASSFTGAFNPPGTETNTSGITNRFVVNQDDAVVDSFGRIHKTETFSVSGAFLHYFTPEVRGALFGTYAQVNYDAALRTGVTGPAGITGGAAVVNPFNPTLKSFEVFYGGGNLIWSPVRDLDIGVEVVYERINIAGRVADNNKGGTAAAGATVVGGTGRTTSFDDNILARFRVQRDF